MRKPLTFLSILATTLTLAFAPRVQAAGETGHSDLMRLVAAIYGLNIEASEFLATVNQSVDKVPLSAATQSGRASAKLHFGTTVTQSDLDLQDFEKLMKNNGKRSLMQVMGMFFKNNAMGGGVASLGNAEAAEALGKAIKKGDGVLFGMGLHYLLDVGAPFHDGYLGALTNPIPVIGKMPFLHKIALGHLVDGTSPDKLNIAKVALAIEAMGPFLITLRESQRDGIGVNQKWLDQLTAQGVDVNDHNSIRNWFFRQDVVKEALQKYFPANQSVDYAQVMLEELKAELKRLKFFDDQKYVDSKIEEIVLKIENINKNPQSKVTLNDLIIEFIDQAWRDGKLRERTVINHTVSDYFGRGRLNVPEVDGVTPTIPQSTRLQDLIYDPQFKDLPEWVSSEIDIELNRKGTHMPYTREWLLDQIVAKITRGMISQKWEKFNSAYTNERAEKKQIDIEHDTLGKIEKHFFGKIGKYVYNPGVEHFNKVRDTWKSLSPAERGQTLLDKIITYTDLIVRTRLHEGMQLHGPSRRLQLQIFIKTMGYIFHEEFRNPITTRGNLAVKVTAYRNLIIHEIKTRYKDGLLTEELLSKAAKYNDYLNAKYNSDQAVGLIQKSASAVNKSARFLQELGRSSSGLRCEALFN